MTAVASDAGDLLQASVLSFPAATMTLTSALTTATAAFSARENPPPSDMDAIAGPFTLPDFIAAPRQGSQTEPVDPEPLQPSTRTGTSCTSLPPYTVPPTVPAQCVPCLTVARARGIVKRREAAAASAELLMVAVDASVEHKHRDTFARGICILKRLVAVALVKLSSSTTHLTGARVQAAAVRTHLEATQPMRWRGRQLIVPSRVERVNELRDGAFFLHLDMRSGCICNHARASSVRQATKTGTAVTFVVTLAANKGAAPSASRSASCASSPRCLPVSCL